MMRSGRVAIIILNKNGWQDTIECLESLFQATYPSFQVIVVDNGSSDGSVARIKEWADGKLPVKSDYFSFDPGNKPVSHVVVNNGLDIKDSDHIGSRQLAIIKLKENLGFAGGNNVGLKYAMQMKIFDHLMVLNNDTVVEKDFIEKMMQGFHYGDKVALVSPKIMNYYTKQMDNYPTTNRFNPFTYLIFLTPLSRYLGKLVAFLISFPLKYPKPAKVYVVCGCCMLFKGEILEEIGFFDERTFLGWEEFIVAEKLLSRGYGTFFMPQSVIYHKIGQSTKKMEPVEKLIAFIKSENYFLNNYFKLPRVQRFLVRSIRFAFFTVQMLSCRSYRRNYVRVFKALFEMPD